MTTDRDRIVTYEHHPKRWLAVVHGRFGYVLDLYPEERDHLRELGCAVVGEFTIRQDAIDAAAAALMSRPPAMRRHGSALQRLVDVPRIA